MPPVPDDGTTERKLSWLDGDVQAKILGGGLSAPSTDPQTQLGAFLSCRKETYAPLDPTTKEIRLVTIFPAKFRRLSGRSMISCYTQKAQLNTARFEAISYVWGDPTVTRDILLDNEVVSVTQNLASALESFEDIGDTVRVMWIDAICINQADNDEKSWQVNMMYDLYEKATKVTVWLGPSLETGELAMEMIECLHLAVGHWVRMLKVAGMGEPTPAGLASYTESLLYNHSGSSRFDLRPLADIFGREWWRRIWVLQEARYAAKTSFQCGRRSVSHDAMLDAVTSCVSMNKQFYKNRSPVKSILGRNSYAAYNTLISSRYETRWGLKNLLWLVGTNPPYQTTLKQDRVYGLLGLAEDAAEIGITVDYSKSCEEVFIDATERLLRQPSGLNVLSFCMTPKSMVLPSWVPDWSARFENNIGFVNEMSETDFSASLNLEARLGGLTTEDGGSVKLISVSGATFDTVTAVLDDQWPEPSDRIVPTTWKFVQSARKFIEAGAKAYRDVEDVVWRALTMDIGETDNNDFDERRSNEQTKKEFYDLEAFLRGEGEDWRRNFSIATRKYYLRCERLQRNRRMIRTSKGYIGVGQQDSKEGDRACVLYGLSVPLTLRPVPGRQDRFEVVGEAWVHGIMDGEFIATNPPEEVFVLQ